MGRSSNSPPPNLFIDRIGTFTEVVNSTAVRVPYHAEVFSLKPSGHMITRLAAKVGAIWFSPNRWLIFSSSAQVLVAAGVSLPSGSNGDESNFEKDWRTSTQTKSHEHRQACMTKKNPQTRAVAYGIGIKAWASSE